MYNEDHSDYMSKRYLLHGMRNYYPSGGMADLLGAYPTQELAEEAITRHKEENRTGRFYDYEITDFVSEVSSGDCW